MYGYLLIRRNFKIHPRKKCLVPSLIKIDDVNFRSFNATIFIFLLSPLKNTGSLLEQIRFSPSKDAPFQIWFKLAVCYLKNKILKVVCGFSLYRHYLFLKKDMTLHLNKLASTQSQDVCLILDQWL